MLLFESTIIKLECNKLKQQEMSRVKHFAF